MELKSFSLKMIIIFSAHGPPVREFGPGIGTGPGWTRAGLARQPIPGSGPGSGLGFLKFAVPIPGADPWSLLLNVSPPFVPFPPFVSRFESPKMKKAGRRRGFQV